MRSFMLSLLRLFQKDLDADEPCEPAEEKRSSFNGHEHGEEVERMFTHMNITLSDSHERMTAVQDKASSVGRKIRADRDSIVPVKPEHVA